MAIKKWKNLASGIIVPEDPRFDENQYKNERWNAIRGLAGQDPMQGANLDILGFYIRDRRKDPPVAICKNCEFNLVKNPTSEKEEADMRSGKIPSPSKLDKAPEFFQEMGECLHIIKSMNLSEDELLLMKIVALAPKPGLNEPTITHMFMDEKEMKKR